MLVSELVKQSGCGAYGGAEPNKLYNPRVWVVEISGMRNIV